MPKDISSNTELKYERTTPFNRHQAGVEFELVIDDSVLDRHANIRSGESDAFLISKGRYEQKDYLVINYSSSWSMDRGASRKGEFFYERFGIPLEQATKENFNLDEFIDIAEERRLIAVEDGEIDPHSEFVPETTFENNELDSLSHHSEPDFRSIAEIVLYGESGDDNLVSTDLNQYKHAISNVEDFADNIGYIAGENQKCIQQNRHSEEEIRDLARFLEEKYKTNNALNYSHIEAYSVGNHLGEDKDDVESRDRENDDQGFFNIF